jgi:hypothetical protein
VPVCRDWLSDAGWDLVELLERYDEIACPGPGAGEAAEVLPCGGDDVAGGMDQAVAGPFRLSGREAVVVGFEEKTAVQARRSCAIRQHSNQVWLIAHECDGRLESPVASVSPVCRSARPRPR